MSAPDVTAVRAGGRITVRVDGVEVRILGGNRAKRAAVVIVASYRRRDWSTGELTADTSLWFACRADADAGAREAEGFLRSERRLRHGGVLQVTPALWAVAVPVYDEAAS